MEWAFTVDGKNTAETEFVTVPDGTSPPLVGEKFIVSSIKLNGVYVIKSREFITIFPEEHAGNLTFGWAFVLLPKS